LIEERIITHLDLQLPCHVVKADPATGLLYKSVRGDAPPLVSVYKVPQPFPAN
jgi:hypothetical protein